VACVPERIAFNWKRIELDLDPAWGSFASRSLDRQAATEAIESIEILDWTRLKPRIYNQLESFD
jgi:hypothetical protein